jgi:pimeloyl-ACP methyl ester carboxylesterase
VRDRGRQRSDDRDHAGKRDPQRPVSPVASHPRERAYTPAAGARAPVDLSYHRYVAAPIPIPELDGVTHSFHEARGARFHVAEAGEGDPLVLLHGWPENWWCWRKVIPQFVDAGYRVVAPDLRGHGWSEVTKDGYEKDNLARDLIALLDAMGLEKVQLIGHDWGAMTGFIASLDNPDRIERFISLGMPHPFQEVSLGATLDLWRLAYQLPLAAPFVGTNLVKHWSGFVPRVIKAGSARHDAFTDRDYELYAETCDPHTTASVYRSFLLRDLPAMARGRYRRRLEVPTRLVIGDREPLTTPEKVGGFEKYADDMELVVFEGVGHFVPEEAPDELLRLARSFLRPARAPAAPAT